MSEAFPNLFMITGPKSIGEKQHARLLEQHVDFVTESIIYMWFNDLELMEPDVAAEDDWVDHVRKQRIRRSFPARTPGIWAPIFPASPPLHALYRRGRNVSPYPQEVVADNYEGFRPRRRRRRSSRMTSATNFALRCF